ncbi:MAG: hypothetical protein K0S54_3584 [Alphaproteobacteria bacterium]|jgi:predicted RNA-binding Zn ribbon-like protein|nr:hypothetical protein [Alphaproteobacteria bacterium]
MKSASRQAIETMTIPAPAEMLCLDYVNTLYWRGSQPQTETLTDIEALAGWVGKDGGLPQERGQELADWAKANPPKAAKLFARAILLREAIHNLFVARAGDRPVADADVGLLNEALAEAPSRDALSKTRTQFGWKVPRGDITAPSILAPVLWSAADLLLKGDPARIRQCANEKCRWVFLDVSKAGARRWCTMNSCGNRAKAHRHYHKVKAAEK